MYEKRTTMHHNSRQSYPMSTQKTVVKNKQMNEILWVQTYLPEFDIFAQHQLSWCLLLFLIN